MVVIDRNFFPPKKYEWFEHFFCFGVKLCNVHKIYFYALMKLSLFLLNPYFDATFLSYVDMFQTIKTFFLFMVGILPTKGNHGGTGPHYTPHMF